MLPGEVGIHSRVVPVLAARRRGLAHRHLRHGPDLWLAGRDGDSLLALVLLLPAVAHAMVAELTPHVVFAIWKIKIKIINIFKSVTTFRSGALIYFGKNLSWPSQVSKVNVRVKWLLFTNQQSAVNNLNINIYAGNEPMVNFNE